MRDVYHDLNIAVEYIPTESLRPYARALRKHSADQSEQLQASIEVFGFVQPLLVDSDNEIVAGHGLREAARKLRLAAVPVVHLDHLDEAQKRALRISLNRLAEKIIERTDIGRAIAQDLHHSKELRPILKSPRFDKEARFLAQTARFESGQVHVPKNAPWLADWLCELLDFPNGRHDDQVDSTSQALQHPTSRTTPLHAARKPRERPTDKPRPAGFKRPVGGKRT